MIDSDRREFGVKLKVANAKAAEKALESLRADLDEVPSVCIRRAMVQVLRGFR